MLIKLTKLNTSSSFGHIGVFDSLILPSIARKNTHHKSVPYTTTDGLHTIYICCNSLPYVCRRNSILVMVLVCCNQSWHLMKGIETAATESERSSPLSHHPRGCERAPRLIMISHYIWLCRWFGFQHGSYSVTDVVLLITLYVVGRGQGSHYSKLRHAARHLVIWRNELVMCSVDVEWRDLIAPASHSLVNVGRRFSLVMLVYEILGRIGQFM
jgi:hypothetical protein